MEPPPTVPDPDPPPAAPQLGYGAIAGWVFACAVFWLPLNFMIPKFDEVYAGLKQPMPVWTAFMCLVSRFARTPGGMVFAMVSLVIPIVLFLKGWRKPQLRKLFIAAGWMIPVWIMLLAAAFCIPLVEMIRGMN